MTEYELDKMISGALKEFSEELSEIPEEGEHIFSDSFERRMQHLLSEPKPHRKIFRHKWMFVAAAVLLATLACSLTVYGSKTNQIHFLADNFSEYQPIGEMDEALPERMDLIYGMEYLKENYIQGVEIQNAEQYTCFFMDEKTGRFLEFSSYPKLMFRYHVSQMEATALELDGREAVYYADNRGMQFIIWSAETSVFVVRSDFDKTELIKAVNTIEVYEVPMT